MRFKESSISISESLSSGTGMFVAKRRESSSVPASWCKPAIDRESRWKTGTAAPCLGGRGVGETARLATEWGGDAGNAVSTAFRNVELEVGGEVFKVVRGDERRLRNVWSGVGEGGEPPCTCLGEVRAVVIVVLGTALALVDRESVPPERILDLGGDERETGDVSRIAPVELLVDSAGEIGRFVGGDVARIVWDVEVAWCLRVGGAVAMAFALARLAAIAAATLLFLVLGGVVVVGTPASASGLGHAFSNCLRDVESRDCRIVDPRSGQIAWNTQNMCRAPSRTAAWGSASAFLTNFSKRSIPPYSMAWDERAPWTSR